MPIQAVEVLQLNENAKEKAPFAVVAIYGI